VDYAIDVIFEQQFRFFAAIAAERKRPLLLFAGIAAPTAAQPATLVNDNLPPGVISGLSSKATQTRNMGA
jgi:hypothetical protein